MPTTEPTPPVRELTEDYEQDVDRLTSKYRLPDDLEPEMRAIERELSDLMGGGITVCDVLRTAIRAALDERDVALRASAQLLGATLAERDEVRERCERLRRVADVASLCGTTPDIVLEALADLHEDDYADDLRPRGGDET